MSSQPNENKPIQRRSKVFLTVRGIIRSGSKNMPKGTRVTWKGLIIGFFWLVVLVVWILGDELPNWGFVFIVALILAMGSLFLIKKVR